MDSVFTLITSIAGLIYFFMINVLCIVILLFYHKLFAVADIDAFGQTCGTVANILS